MVNVGHAFIHHHPKKRLTQDSSSSDSGSVSFSFYNLYNDQYVRFLYNNQYVRLK